MNPFASSRKRSRPSDASPYKTPRKSASLGNVTRIDENELLKEATTGGVTSFRGVFKQPATRPVFSKASSFSTYNPVISHSNDATSLLFSPPKKESSVSERFTSLKLPTLSKDAKTDSIRDAITTDKQEKQETAKAELPEKPERKKLVLMTSLPPPVGKIAIHKPGVKVQKAAPAVALTEIVLETAPLDWTLVTACVIVSKQRFDGLATAATSRMESKLVKSACTGEFYPEARAHLATWSFVRKPSPSQEQVLKRAFSKKPEHCDYEESSEMRFWNQHEEAFQQALRGAYNGLRYQVSGANEAYFYCTNAEFGVVVRRVGEEDGLGVLEALITKTSPGLREMLRAREIEGQMLPLTKGHLEIKLSEEKMPPKHLYAVYISDNRAVHRLVEFLGAWTDPQATRRASYGTARLFAPWAFTNASISFAHVEDKGLVTKTLEGSNALLHRIEIRGPMLPTQLEKLMQFMNEVEVQVTEIEPTTRGANLFPNPSGPWQASPIQDDKYTKTLIKDNETGKWTIKM